MEPYQKSVSLKHMRMKRRLISQGKQKASEAGSPFKEKPSFKRSKSAPPIGEQMDNINEESAMSAGSIEGSATPVKTKNSKQEEQDIMEEQKLRQYIKSLISEIHNEKDNFLFEETKFRNIIKKLILEGEEDIQHDRTGINILEDLLKRIIPIREEDFKSLTTAPEQRASFRAHTINAVQNLLLYDPKNIEKLEKEEGLEEEVDIEKLNEQEELEEINLDVKSDKDATDDTTTDSTDSDNFDKYIDIKRRKTEKKHKAFKSLPSEDETGRNVALKSFERVEKNVIDAYALLDNEEDQDLFYDYLITNLKLYFDRWEQEIVGGQIDEPTNPTYEKEKEQSASQK